MLTVRITLCKAGMGVHPDLEVFADRISLFSMTGRWRDGHQTSIIIWTLDAALEHKFRES